MFEASNPVRKGSSGTEGDRLEKVCPQRKATSGRRLLLLFLRLNVKEIPFFLSLEAHQMSRLAATIIMSRALLALRNEQG